MIELHTHQAYNTKAILNTKKEERMDNKGGTCNTNEALLSMIHSQVNQICNWKIPDPSELILEDMFHLAGKINDLASIQLKCNSVQSIKMD